MKKLMIFSVFIVCLLAFFGCEGGDESIVQNKQAQAFTLSEDDAAAMDVLLQRIQDYNATHFTQDGTTSTQSSVIYKKIKLGKFWKFFAVCFADVAGGGLGAAIGAAISGGAGAGYGAKTGAAISSAIVGAYCFGGDVTPVRGF